MHALRIASLALLCFLLAAIPASASYLYSNGPYNGNYDAFTINFGYVVSETFTLSSASTVVAFDFYSWSTPGDTPLTVDWSITSSENGGTVYGSGAGAALTNLIISTNSYNYQINDDTVPGLNVNLAAGSYWLNLQNAVTSQGNPLYWDENDGPSLASENSIGTIGSESFDICGGGGRCGTTTTGTTPEPGSIVLFSSGMVGLAGVLRRKLISR